VTTSQHDILLFDNEEPITYMEAVMGLEFERWLDVMRLEFKRCLDAIKFDP